jgi:hypothetical protein
VKIADVPPPHGVSRKCGSSSTYSVRYAQATQGKALKNCTFGENASPMLKRKGLGLHYSARREGFCHVM